MKEADLGSKKNYSMKTCSREKLILFSSKTSEENERKFDSCYFRRDEEKRINC